jgi:hypothetical protein
MRPVCPCAGFSLLRLPWHVHGHDVDKHLDKCWEAMRRGSRMGPRAYGRTAAGRASIVPGRDGFPAKGRAGWVQAGPGTGSMPKTRR